MPISKKKQYKGVVNQEEDFQEQPRQLKKKLKQNKTKTKELNYRSAQEIQQESQRNFWIVFSLSTLMVIFCWVGSNYIGQPYIHANNVQHITQNLNMPNSDVSRPLYKQDYNQKKNQKMIPAQNIDKTIGQNTNQKLTQEQQIKKLQKEIMQAVNPKQQVIKSYRYGDSINFTKLRKRDRYIKETLLKQENLEYASMFFNMLGRDISNNEELKKTYQLQFEYYDRKYKINQFKQQIEICVIVYGYQNHIDNRYKASLDSIFQQDYQNYKVYYVADNSPKTAELVQHYMNQNAKFAQKMTFFNNNEKKGKSRVLYEIGHQYCKPGSIMYPLEGSDNLIGRQVFKLMNAVYQDKNAKFVYMNFLEFYTDQNQLMLAAGYSRQTPNYVKTNKLYRQKATPLNLRSWASDLFLAIPEADYKFDGQFVPTGDDVMIMYTLQQLAGEQVQYIPQIVYFYNGDIEISQQEQNIKQRIVHHARGRQKFETYSNQILWRVNSPK